MWSAPSLLYTITIIIKVSLSISNECIDKPIIHQLNALKFLFENKFFSPKGIYRKFNQCQ